MRSASVALLPIELFPVESDDCDPEDAAFLRERTDDGAAARRLTFAREWEPYTDASKARAVHAVQQVGTGSRDAAQRRNTARVPLPLILRRRPPPWRPSC